MGRVPDSPGGPGSSQGSSQVGDRKTRVREGDTKTEAEVGVMCLKLEDGASDQGRKVASRS